MAVFVEAEFTDILFCGSPKEKQALELVFSEPLPP